MGYAFYFLAIDYSGVARPAGYGVLATCDKRGCDAEIDRGLAYLCGDGPHRWFDAAPGCGFYFCEDHLSGVGPRGGCGHRQHKAWGVTLACMVQSPDKVYCLSRTGHEGPHAWEREQP